MPARSRFVDAPHYYSTLFHELVHGTGHESRLHRSFGEGFGDELYSKEELIAEMGAAFLSSIALSMNTSGFDLRNHLLEFAIPDERVSTNERDVQRFELIQQSEDLTDQLIAFVIRQLTKDGASS